MDLQDTLEAHQAWLVGGSKGKRADLHAASLRNADLPHASLRSAGLAYANLHGADLRDADLRETNLKNAILIGANLSRADLRGAKLVDAHLARAFMVNTRLGKADLNGADLSGASGLTDPAKYLEREFEKDEDGVLCYKTFGKHFDAPKYWKIGEGSVIEENVNPLRTLDCACGVNVATRQWVRGRSPAPPREVWRCRIAWPDLAGVVVPYNSDGKIRAERVKLLEKIDL